MHKLDSNPISWWEIRSRRLAAAVSQSSYEVAARRRAVNLSKAHSPREERSSVSFTSWFCSRILVSITQNVRPHAHTHTHYHTFLRAHSGGTWKPHTALKEDLLVLWQTCRRLKASLETADAW